MRLGQHEQGDHADGRRPFPWGTPAVNLSGTLLLGVLVGAAVSDDALL